MFGVFNGFFITSLPRLRFSILPAMLSDKDKLSLHGRVSHQYFNFLIVFLIITEAQPAVFCKNVF